MLATMATPKTTKPAPRAPRSTGRASTKAAEAPKRTLAEIGREAQREALLAALEANNWNLTATARDLGLTNASNVIRALRTLGLGDRYEAAKAEGKIVPGKHVDTESL